MLDDFKTNDFYEYAINLKKYYHAYIFEVDNIENNLPLIIAFAKTVICKNHYTNLNSCQNCNVCNLIDKNYYSGLKIIEPDGLNIKKEQIQNLQKEFSLKSSDNNNLVYIIKNADKMNLSAANSLLKFLEEPVDGLIAILITTNKKMLLPTILSRCNLITLKLNQDKKYNLDNIKFVLDFIKLFIKEKENTIAYLKSNFFNKFKSKEEVLEAFNLMEDIFDNMLNMYYKTNDLNSPIYDIISSSLKEVSINDLLFYLDKIVIFKNELINISNINLNLFMDRFIIEISRIK